jgi:NADPH2:quinone reductase
VLLARLQPGEHTRFIGRALNELAASRIRPVIGRRFPLEAAADAHTAIEARSVIGKTLLTVDHS